MDRPSDPVAPPPLPSAPAHRGPPEGWRPLSGLAITAFVLALGAVVPSVLGLWVASAVPLVLGVAAFALVDPASRRGRGFAVAAVAISLPLALVMYASHSAMRGQVRDMGNHLLAALRGGDEAGLVAWIDEGARGEGAAARIRGRYAAARETLGSYEGPVEAGSLWLGFGAALVPPSDVEEMGATGDGADGADGADVPRGSVWIRVPFERGNAHVAVVLAGADDATGPARALARLSEQRPAAIVRDLRFFRAR